MARFWNVKQAENGWQPDIYMPFPDEEESENEDEATEKPPKEEDFVYERLREEEASSPHDN